MAVTIQLVYTVNVQRATPASVVAAVSAAGAPVPADYLTAIGGIIAGDNTVVVGTQVQRTISWQTNAAFDSQFSAAQRLAPFPDLMTGIIRNSCKSPVVNTSNTILG